MPYQQEAKLSQRDRATLYFIIQFSSIADNR